MPKRLRSLSPSDVSNISTIEGLEVNIVDFKSGLSLPQLHISKAHSSFTSSFKANRYLVFAKAGLKFGIDVIANASFHWGEANALEVAIGFDLGNVVNQKRVYLVRPGLDVKPSALIKDEALHEMWHHEDEFRFCIDHVLIQNPESYEGEVDSFYFAFADVCEDAIHAAATKARPRKKVGNHQGKIVVDVTRIVAQPTQLRRFPGLFESLTTETRSGTLALLHAGISIEIKLEREEKLGTIQYGGAFRAVSCEQPMSRPSFHFEFVYRSVDIFPEIVDPRFQHEIAENAYFHTVKSNFDRHAAQAGPADAQIPASDQPPQTDGASQPVARDKSVVTTRTTVSSLSSSKLDLDGDPQPGSSTTNTTLSRLSPSNTTGSNLYHRVQEELTQLESDEKECQERDWQQLNNHRYELEVLDAQTREIKVDFARKHSQLDTDEFECLKAITEQKGKIELEMTRVEEQRSRRQKTTDEALEQFVTTLRSAREV